ncbi:Kinesin-like protein KIF11 [Portunus trituberculatus]|uniref:Kinesin-like protein KIF11 n=1 Tax=Portunus trituberculatus TaxID=210409 RepID=A0A5B7HLN2_PORTR|nr:Kinesin-like protein KIF11 [Portunus trituberculatus]
MRVSFLELYNEELFDLLSAHDDFSKLRLHENSSKKGSYISQGLEVLVRSKSEVYSILEKRSKQRQTAATLMNTHSSRSHTVFTVTVHMKDTVDGDELMKTGELHLVDLVGSGNIGRSGAVEKRARQAGNINMSFLTLGRVITALVEKVPHIPYRESKLTHLQDALRGHTKTSVIATIFPVSINQEETLSTLNYARRAKNIQNKPEINQKLHKEELIQEYSQETESLRRDLLAMREKSGNTSSCTQRLLHATAQEREKQRYLVSAHARTEERLQVKGKALIDTTTTATSDLARLHNKLDRKLSVDSQNTLIFEKFQTSYAKT